MDDSILRGVLLRGVGERLNGIQEVSGSIPLISTKKIKTTLINKAVFIFFVLNKMYNFFILIIENIKYFCYNLFNLLGGDFSDKAY